MNSRSLLDHGIPAGFSLVRTVPDAVHHDGLHTIRTVPGTVLHHSTPAVLHHSTPAVLHHSAPAVVHTAAAPAVIHSTAVRAHAAPAVIPARQAVIASAPVIHHAVAAAAPAVVPARQTVLSAAPAVVPVVAAEESIPADYNFGYSISDVVSGDSKTRQETREGDVVTGSYSVADPDGRIRTVTYTADPVHGFQAKVTYDGQEGPVAIPFNPPVSAPVSPVAPVVTQTPVVAPVQSPAPAPAAQAEEVIIAKDQTPEAETESVTESVTSRQQQPSSTFRAVTAVPAVPLAPRVSTAQRLLTTFPEIDLSQYLRFLNTQHRAAVHHLPSNPALHHLQAGVRNVAGAPVDLGQFTFLSGGQVLV